MGTRADFYIGRGSEAKWIGSTAWDGYPGGISPEKPFPKGRHLFDAKTEQTFRDRLDQYFAGREDVSLPERDGWPWPWDTSHTTDYSYAFDNGRVYASCFGHKWFDPRKAEPEEHGDSKPTEFPNMKSIQRVTLGKRSGVIVVSVGAK